MKISLRPSSDLAPEHLLQAAAGAVAARLDQVWLADNPLERSAPITAAVLAARHPELSIGLGVVSARERNPVVMTQEMVALQSYSRGQIVVGLGIGRDSHSQRLGLPDRSGLELLASTAHVIHELSAGRAIPPLDGSDGEPIALKTTSSSLPVYVGASGPKTLALAGEIGEGAILSLGSTAAAASSALKTCRSTFTPSERAEHFAGVCYVAFGGVGDGSYERLEKFAALYLSLIADHPVSLRLLEGTGLDIDDVRVAVQAHQAGRSLPPEVVRSMGIAGSVDECLERLHSYQASGVDDVALGIGRWNDALPATLEDVATLARAWAAASEAA